MCAAQAIGILALLLGSMVAQADEESEATVLGSQPSFTAKPAWSYYLMTERASAPDYGAVEMSLETRSFVNQPNGSSLGPQVWFDGGVGLGRDFTLRVDALRDLSGDNWKPSVALEWTFLKTQGDGLDLKLAGRLRSEGFTEIEGEMEWAMIGTYRMGAMDLTGNLVAGTDFDGNESDCEAYLAGGYHIGSLLSTGLESDNRWGLGPSVSQFEHFVGPYVQHDFGAWSVLLSGGYGNLHFPGEPASYGAQLGARVAARL